MDNQYRDSYAGTGADIATWTFAVSRPGQWRVAATWPAATNLASNSPFTIKDGSTTVGTVSVNQEVAPNDYQIGSTWWEILGDFTITETTMQVQLSDNANQTVRADAIQILWVGDSPTEQNADVQIIDDGNSGYTTSGAWGSWINGYWGDYHYANGGGGANESTWTATVDPGIYRVSATWIPGVTRATNSPFTVFDGATSLGTVRLDQELYPSSFNDAGFAWEEIGVFQVLSGSLIVKLTDDADESVNADAIHIERLDGYATGRTTTFEYDLQDRLVKVTEPDPDGAGPLLPPVTEYDYDLAGQLLSMTDAEGRVTNYEHDGLGRTVEVQAPDPDGAGSLSRPVSSFAYDAVGNVLSSTDPLSHVTAYAYDNLYRRTKITDAEAGETDFTYDAAGRMLSLTDPVGNATAWQYDALGRVTLETNELNKTRTFKYDAASNLTERVDRLGRKVEFVYDGLYRNTAEKWYDGASLVRTLSFAYDAAGQLTAASDPAASYAYSYDGSGRLANETQALTGLTPQIQYQSKYDGANRRTELQAVLGGTADFKNAYQYDNLSRVTSIQQQGIAGGNAVAEKRIDLTYNATGQFEALTRYADLEGSEFVANSFYDYDGMGRLTKLLHTEDSTAPSSGWGVNPLAGYEFTYDASSRLASINSYLDGLSAYTHDDTDQLVGADHTGQTDESYSYDANGNRIMGGHTIGDNNQLLSDGVYNYTYDDEGNRLTKTKISTGAKEEYTWDHRNRLTKVTFKNSGATVIKTVDQSYDVFNQWVRRTVDPDGATGSAALQNTFFSHEDGQIALEFDGTAAADLSHRYLWGPAVDQLLADEQVSSLVSQGNTLWPLADQVGTIRDIVDRNETTSDVAVANHRRYDSFGNLISESNATVDLLFGFTGRALDESTGLQNNLNRWYDAATGNWMSEDPIGFAGRDTNLERYVNNETLTSQDPKGLLRPSTFWDEWTEGQREAWFESFRRQYGAFIQASAAKHCVPEELLAAVIANEMIDYTWYEWLGEGAGIGKSLGPAQIHMTLADKYDLYPFTLKEMLKAKHLDTSQIANWDEVDWGMFHKINGEYYQRKREYLNDPKSGIDAAGKLMAIYMKELHDHLNAPGPWGSSPPAYGMLPNEFVGLAGLSKYSLIQLKMQVSTAGKPCKSITTSDVDQPLLRAMQALFNDGIRVIKPGGVNSNVLKHVSNMDSLDDVFLGKVMPTKKSSPQPIIYKKHPK